MGYTPPFLQVRKVAGGWSFYPPSDTTGDDVTLYPNGIDTTGYLTVNGAGAMLLGVGTGTYWSFRDGGTERFVVKHVNPDLQLENVVADKNIFLKTSGTGVVKFGTYTGGAATDSTGYITILDAAGNTRKLMVQA